MNYFLETYSPPKQNQEEIDNLIRMIIKNENEYVIKEKKKPKNKKLPTNTSPGPDGFKGEFY